jgi:CheY-like chemotaxis protein
MPKPGVLVVEDEALIAMDVQDILEGAGYHVLGPAQSVEAAMAVLATCDPEIAVLDINLTRSTVFTLADVLAERNIPFCFLTGHSRAVLPDGHKHRPVVAKPFLPETFLAVVRDLERA